MRAILSLLAVALLFAPVRAAFYTDVPDGAPLSHDITDAAYHQLMEGYPDGAFHPSQPLARADAVMVYARLLNVALRGFMVLPGAGVKAPEFADVSATHWLRPAAAFLAQKGVPLRALAGSFQPTAPVSRGEFVVELYRLLHAGVVVSEAEAASWLGERSLLPAGWQAELKAAITRSEVARTLIDVLAYLTQHAETEGAIASLSDSQDGRRWMELDTAIGVCRLALPDRGVEMTGTDALQIGMKIHTVSDAVAGGGQTYYRVRKVTVLPKEMAAK